MEIFTGKEVHFSRVSSDRLDKTLLSANESGITVVSYPFTLGLPKDVAIKYAKQGISKNNADGFVRTEFGVTLVHGDIRLQFTEEEANVVVNVINTEF